MKKFKFIKEFQPTGQTFGAMYAAKRWLRENGYSSGSTDLGTYVPIVKGEYDLPQKYRNLSKAGIDHMAGVIHSIDYREGKVEVRLFNDPELLNKQI